MTASMPRRVLVTLGIACLLLLGGCGGGSSTVTTISGGGLSGSGGPGTEVVLDQPTGSNTTEIVVDEGPPEAFALGVTNVPYVSVTLCAPGSTSACVTLDHVLLDTGSIGLRVLKSAVAGLNLPAVNLPADPAHGLPAGPAVECYPFVLGGIWGPVARADVRLGGESASALPIQLLDDATPPEHAAPQDCIDAAEGGLITGVTTLQAKGVLGVGMLRYDCGQTCVDAPPATGYSQYYVCPAAGCTPARVAADLQLQNPVAHFAAHTDGTVNNNGTVIMLPAVPETGAAKVRGRLVFGIGTQANNQLPPPQSLNLLSVGTDPAQLDSYLFVTSSIGARSYPYSYIDSGSNGLFFEDATLARSCGGSSGSQSSWYCPSAVVRRSATIRDATGATVLADFAVANADVLFSTSNLAFSNLGGALGQDPNSFVWGLPFFFGRTVYTSIWGQSLAQQGPWWAY